MRSIFCALICCGVLATALLADEPQTKDSPQPAAAEATAAPVNEAPAKPAEDASAKPVDGTPAKPADEVKWVSLFNGKDLTGWKVPQFGGEGEVTVENGEMRITMGAMISGICYAGEKPFPKENFEIEVEAKRTMGSDFFATITFPIGDSYASFVTGGWGGNLFGVSCVNDQDASENQYMTLQSVKSNQWYKVRVRVSKDRVQCFFNDKMLADIPREGNRFRTRMEVDLSQPMGITNYCCESVIRSIRYRTF